MQIEFTAKSYDALAVSRDRQRYSPRISLAAMARNRDNEAEYEREGEREQRTDRWL